MTFVQVGDGRGLAQTRGELIRLVHRDLGVTIRQILRFRGHVPSARRALDNDRVRLAVLGAPYTSAVWNELITIYLDADVHFRDYVHRREVAADHFDRLRIESRLAVLKVWINRVEHADD
jgi:predicted methyltransferase MtxX (methanogen marker protein 4)